MQVRDANVWVLLPDLGFSGFVVIISKIKNILGGFMLSMSKNFIVGMLWSVIVRNYSLSTVHYVLHAFEVISTETVLRLSL